MQADAPDADWYAAPQSRNAIPAIRRASTRKGLVGYAAIEGFLEAEEPQRAPDTGKTQDHQHGPAGARPRGDTTKALGGKVEADRVPTPWLREPGATFVTFEKAGRLARLRRLSGGPPSAAGGCRGQRPARRLFTIRASRR